uniref:G-protein coupled receptors family 1 profile domain-containing protein n=1 Tax=Ditylenchus dipsaci TaxID=166011 RepID=A0A915CRH3_9BILA
MVQIFLLYCFIALDRLLCIAYPQRYSSMNKQVYFCIIVAFVLAFPFYNGFLSYQRTLINPDKYVHYTQSFK